MTFILINGFIAIIVGLYSLRYLAAAECKTGTPVQLIAAWGIQEVGALCGISATFIQPNVGFLIVADLIIVAGIYWQLSTERRRGISILR